MKNIDFT